MATASPTCLTMVSPHGKSRNVRLYEALRTYQVHECVSTRVPKQAGGQEGNQKWSIEWAVKDGGLPKAKQRGNGQNEGLVVTEDLQDAVSLMPTWHSLFMMPSLLVRATTTFDSAPGTRERQ